MTALARTNDSGRPALTTASSAFNSNSDAVCSRTRRRYVEDEDLCKNIPPLNRANNTDYYFITKSAAAAIPYDRPPLIRPIILDNTINIMLMIICYLEHGYIDNIYYPLRRIGSGRVSAVGVIKVNAQQ